MSDLEALRTLLRELLMREGLAFPETEQDKAWHQEQIKFGDYDKYREAAGLSVTIKTV